jgi:hypothetical protein
MRTLCLTALLALLFGLAGCQKAPELGPPDTATGGVKMEIRYNAIAALARRGSTAMSDPDRLDVLAEMLDEAKQQRQFRIKLKDGREVPDATAAQSTTESALKAIVELHKKRPEIDLTRLHPAITKLTTSNNGVIRQEALRTKAALNLP